MTKKEFFDFVEKDNQRMLELLKAKNNDYTAGSDNALANFDQAERIGIDPVKGILLRVLDKMKRFETFAKHGFLSVENETVLDTADDIEGYMKAIKAYLKNRNYP